MWDDKAVDKPSRRFSFFFPQMLHVSFLLMLVDLLLTVPVQPLVTDRDVNSEACDNHVPAYN